LYEKREAFFTNQGRCIGVPSLGMEAELVEFASGSEKRINLFDWSKFHQPIKPFYFSRANENQD
jgi:hypothetical protein